MPFGWGQKDKAVALDARQLDAFAAAIPADPGAAGPAQGWRDEDTRRLLGRELPLFTAFLTQHARSSVGGGVLRFLLPESDPPLVGWNGPGGWRSDWPSAVPAVAFASDWTGRLYLLATRQILRDSEPPVVLLDPATGEVVVLDHTLGEFLGETLARDWRRLLDADRLAAWQTAGGTVPTPQECVCPKVPMFLGGSAEMGDLELSPLLVAISVAGQLWEQVRTLPPGTPMSGVSIR